VGPRAQRLARGWTGAGLATSFAAASHVAADGPAPPAVLVLLSLALSGPLCVALAGRMLSRASLLAGVLLSQGLLHALFAGTGAVTTVVDATRPAGLHGAAHAGPALVLQVESHAGHAGPAMVLSHVLAAAACYALVRHGEVAAVVLLDTLRLRVRRLWQALSVPLAVLRPRAAAGGRPHVLTDQSLLRPVRSHRGPPPVRRRGPRRSALPGGPAPLPAG